jgi:hypothetical protein
MARKGPRHKKRNAGAAFDVEPERKKPRLFVGVCAVSRGRLLST